MSNTKREASEEILERLANNTKRMRAERGWTQKQLADRCGFPASYIGDVEQGTVNITLANLEALADGMGCRTFELVQRPETKDADES